MNVKLAARLTAGAVRVLKAVIGNVPAPGIRPAAKHRRFAADENDAAVVEPELPAGERAVAGGSPAKVVLDPVADDRDLLVPDQGRHGDAGGFHQSGVDGDSPGLVITALAFVLVIKVLDLHSFPTRRSSDLKSVV